MSPRGAGTLFEQTILKLTSGVPGLSDVVVRAIARDALPYLLILERRGNTRTNFQIARMVATRWKREEEQRILNEHGAPGVDVRSLLRERRPETDLHALRVGGHCRAAASLLARETNEILRFLRMCFEDDLRAGLGDAGFVGREMKLRRHQVLSSLGISGAARDTGALNHRDRRRAKTLSVRSTTRRGMRDLAIRYYGYLQSPTCGDRLADGLALCRALRILPTARLTLRLPFAGSLASTA